MVFRRCHIHIYDNWGTSYLVSRLVPANIVAPRIIAWNDNYLRWKREGLPDGPIQICDPRFVELLFRRVHYIDFHVPRKCCSSQGVFAFTVWGATNSGLSYPKEIRNNRVLRRDHYHFRHKIEGLADSHPMISHIHIVLLTIRIIFVVPRNRSSGQILLHI